MRIKNTLGKRSEDKFKRNKLMLLLVRQFLHPTTSVRHEKNIAEKNLSFDYQWFIIPTINMCKTRKCDRKKRGKDTEKPGNLVMKT